LGAIERGRASRDEALKGDTRPAGVFNLNSPGVAPNNCLNAAMKADVES
jgi:hypothetical protein